VVNQATWAGNNYVYAFAQSSELSAVADATVNGGGEHAKSFCQRHDDLIDLVRKFASRYQNEGTGFVRLAAAIAFGQTGEKWQSKGKGLSRTCTATTKYVTAGNCVGDRGFLNRERGRNACVVEVFD
jgi:hypothetical protein